MRAEAEWWEPLCGHADSPEASDSKDPQGKVAAKRAERLPRLRWKIVHYCTINQLALLQVHQVIMCGTFPPAHTSELFSILRQYPRRFWRRHSHRQGAP